jgi:XkdW protein
MTLYDRIIAIYPELKSEDFFPGTGTIVLQNDSDGKGDYIKAWNHPTLPQPTQEQLDALEVTP